MKKLILLLPILLLTVSCGELFPELKIKKQPPKEEVPETPTVICEGTNLINTFAGGTGIESDPYLICTTQQFLNMSTDLSSYYKLEDDLNFNGVTFNKIGDDATNFTGVIDGNNKTLDNIYFTSTENNSGIFGNTNNSTIKNIVIKNAQILIGSNDNIGVLIGKASGTTIENITIETSSVTGNDYVGLLAGEITNSQVTDITVLSNGSFGNSYVAGIIGKGESTIISNVTNKTNVSNSGKDYVSGVIAYAKNISLTNITNEGDIVGRDYVGGIFAYMEGTNNTITTLSNSGDITGNNYVGGIFANQDGVFNSITQLSNTGNIIGNDATGGVMGRSSDNGHYSYMSNTGSVTATNGYSVGGLIGESGVSRISYSYNSGAVTGDADLGGIAGYIFDNSANSFIMEYAYNVGELTGLDDYHGGIVGNIDVTADYSNFAFNYVYNMGVLNFPGTEGGSIFGMVFGVLPGTESCDSLIWSNEVSGVNKVYGDNSEIFTCTNLVELTSVESTLQQSYIDEGWDFDNLTTNGFFDIWTMDTYPTLSE